MAKTSIENRLRDFRRQVRRVLGIYGVCWLLAVSIGLATISGLADWLLDLTPGVRAILLLLLSGTTLWTVYRFLLVPLLVRLRDLDLALRVETQFPTLNDELASAVQFSEEPAGSERSGSAKLKQAVVADASRRVLAIDFAAALDRTTTRRAAASATAIITLATALVLISPGSARIAIARLVNPFGNVAWPRETHLTVVDPPHRLARGEPFRLVAQVTQGRVPDRAAVFYEFEGGELANEPLRPHGDRQFTGGIEAVSRSFDFYVRAGDGITELKHVDVVPPPELQGLKVRLKFPDYTGLPPDELPDDKGQVRAVWGTRVDLSARSSKPLAKAELRIGTDQSVEAVVSPDGTNLQASFTLEASGSYWIALCDPEGFENRQASRYDLKVLDDQTPEVFIERPASDIEVTPTAHVPLRVVIKDDFGIQDAVLQHSGSTPDTMNDVPLWSGAERPKRHVIEHVWHLAELGLTAGSSVSYRLSARDADDLRGPHVGQSRQLRLIVVTPEELARRLEDKQSFIYQELERIRKLQDDARLQVSEAREQLAREAAMSKADLARLQSAETLQRQVQRRITSPSEGLQNHIDQVQQDLKNNHIDDSSVSDQMDAVAAGLDKIARDELPQVEQNLSRVRKSAEESGDKNTQSAGLAEAQKHQDSVVATLDELLERMSKWETYRGIARDVRQLQEQQEQIADQTHETGKETIGKPKESLPAEAQAQLSKIAAQQEQAREQLGRLQRKMEQMAERIDEKDPVGSESLRQAVEGSRQSGTSEQMQKASASVQQNQVGAAESAQRQASDDLKEMLDTLENNRETDLAKIVEKLRQAEKKLAEIRQRQLEQLQRTKDAQSNQDSAERRRELERLARREKELQQETARLAQQLRRVRAEQAGKTSSSASNRMGQARQQMEQGEGEQAGEEQQKVLEDLEKAQQEVAEARREAEAQLAMEQLSKIADTLASLHTRQQNLKDETIRLEQSRAEKVTWTRPQLASLRDAAETQQNVRQDTDTAREVLTAAPVFALTLTRAMSNMERAADLLNQRQADSETQSAQQAAINRLAQLLDSLKNEPGGSDEQSEQGGGGGQGQQGQPRDGIPPIAQLKMLKSLQIEINGRTQELAETRDREKRLSPAQEKELQSLSEEQGTLADLVRRLTQPDEEGEN